MHSAVVHRVTEAMSIDANKWPASRIRRIFCIVAVSLSLLLILTTILPQYYTFFTGIPPEYRSLLNAYRDPSVKDIQWITMFIKDPFSALQSASTELLRILYGCITVVCGIYFKWYGKLWNYISKKYSNRGETFRSLVYLAIMSILFATLTFNFLMNFGESFKTIVSTAVFHFIPISLFYAFSRKKFSPFLGAAIVIILSLIYSEACWNYLVWQKLSSCSKLKENQSTRELFQLADQVGYPRDSIYTADVETSYAMKTFFSSAIVMEESVPGNRHAASFFAHEYQHTQQSRIVTLLSANSYEILQFLTATFVASNPVFFEMFGFAGEPLIAAPIISEILNFPINLVLYSIKLIVTRMGEYDADNSAIRLGYGKDLIATFTILGHELYLNPIFEFFHRAHPCLVNRIKNVIAQK